MLLHPLFASRAAAQQLPGSVAAAVVLHLHSCSAQQIFFLFVEVSKYLSLKQRMYYSDLPNMASPQVGGRVIFATDEWFAAAGT